MSYKWGVHPSKPSAISCIVLKNRLNEKNMEIKPINQRKSPNYPILEYYIENPEIFSQHIPHRWIKNQYVATSLSVFVLCGNMPCTAKPNSKNIEVVTTVKGDETIPSDEIKTKQDGIKIAPIFAHGEGTGATGCLVMSPPVFISEDEARKIIFDALAVEKIALDTTNCPIIKFKAPPIANDSYGFKDSKAPNADVEIKMDAYNAEYNLSIQFVSVKDYLKFHSDDGYASSVQGYDTKDAATLIREELNANGKNNAVVFYDPLVNIDFGKYDDWEKDEKKAKEEATELLLAQVHDFIEWLKMESIIK